MADEQQQPPRRNFTDADLKALIKILSKEVATWTGFGILKLAGYGFLIIVLILAVIGIKHA